MNSLYSRRLTEITELFLHARTYRYSRPLYTTSWDDEIYCDLSTLGCIPHNYSIIHDMYFFKFEKAFSFAPLCLAWQENLQSDSPRVLPYHLTFSYLYYMVYEPLGRMAGVSVNDSVRNMIIWASPFLREITMIEHTSRRINPTSINDWPEKAVLLEKLLKMPPRIQKLIFPFENDLTQQQIIALIRSRINMKALSEKNFIHNQLNQGHITRCGVSLLRTIS